MSSKIVVVDDEADVVVYLTAVLSTEDYEVHTADNAHRGMELIQEVGPDLICLDIMMPKKSGITLYTELRAMDRLEASHPDIAVGILSYGGDVFDGLDPVAEGMIFIPEPTTLLLIGCGSLAFRRRKP